MTFHVHKRRTQQVEGFKYRVCHGDLPCNQPAASFIGTAFDMEGVYKIIDRVADEETFEVPYPKPAEECEKFVRFRQGTKEYSRRCYIRGSHVQHQVLSADGCSLYWTD